MIRDSRDWPMEGVIPRGTEKEHHAALPIRPTGFRGDLATSNGIVCNRGISDEAQDQTSCG